MSNRTFFPGKDAGRQKKSAVRQRNWDALVRFANFAAKKTRKSRK
jgi:hypothetical protein